jgi:uncharacterized protein YjdB/poly-gamma-glutamate capsule biosynthesis protein CapA/YwtB (metallophosphatase superfamily)
MKKTACFLGIVLVGLMLFASGAYASAVAKIELPSALSIDRGTTYMMPAKLFPEGAAGAISWSSSRPQFASVTKEGRVTARKMGRTVIIARVNGKKAQCTLTVTMPSATRIKLKNTSKTLNPGATFQLKAAFQPQYTSEKPVWTSSDPSVATVSDTGLVTATADGDSTRTCHITAALKNGRVARCTIKVVKIPQKSIRMVTRAQVPLYSSRPLTAAVYPLDAFDRSITWQVVKNPAVASVDPKTGVVQGLKKGTAVVEARSANGRKARCTVTVKMVRYSRFALTPSSKTIMKGDSFSLTAKRLPVYVSYPNVTFQSSDPSVATVSPAGKITGINRGYATITAIADNGRIKRTTKLRVLSNDDTHVTISAIGDVMLGGDPRRRTDKYFEELWANDPSASYFFGKIKSEFRGITVANLEMPLYDTNRVIQGSREHIFRGKPAYAKALKAGEIDVVDIDNNHIMDYGNAGFKSTLTALNNYSIGYFGRGHVSYRMQKGVRIGFVGYRPESASISKIKNHVKSIKQNCDILVASFHWGSSYNPTSKQRAYGRAAIDAGADLVLGHHTHLVSGIELYKGKHIVYGLGTIVSAVNLPADTDTFIYRHTFSVSGTSVKNADFDIVPVKMTRATSRNDAQPDLATADEADAIIQKIKRYSPENNPF